MNNTNTNSAPAVQRYRTTIRFIGGILEGLTATNINTFQSKVGWVCRKPIGNTSPYVVVSSDPV